MDPFIGEVRLVGFNFAPVDWAICNGQTLSISENSTLFNLIGTTYGGNGQTTYNIPNLQGRTPIHQGSNGVTNYVIGQMGGAETVTVNVTQYPMHSHTLSASSNTTGGVNNPNGNVLGDLANVYAATSPTGTMGSSTLSPSVGGNQPHNNLQPFLALNWIIALYGVYPTQS
jgi:microcystin-dependent protein